MDVIEGAAFHGLYGCFIVFHGGNEDDVSFRANLPREPQDLDAIGLRHFDVGNQDLIVSGVQFLLGGFPGINGLHAMPFAPQRNIEHLADGALVVAHQNASHAILPLR